MNSNKLVKEGMFALGVFGMLTLPYIIAFLLWYFQATPDSYNWPPGCDGNSGCRTPIYSDRPGLYLLGTKGLLIILCVIFLSLYSVFKRKFITATLLFLLACNCIIARQAFIVLFFKDIP